MTEVNDRPLKSFERNVYVIDDDRDMRQSLHFLLATSHRRAWPFAAAEDFFDHICRLEPSPILLDLRMPKMDGIEVLHELRKRDVAWPVIMMTAHGDVATAVRSVKLGAIDFLEKPFESEELELSLTMAFDMLDTAKGELASRGDARELLDRLSVREHDVLAILVEGASNKAAAHELNLSVRTVEMHRKNALLKLQLRSIAEIVALLAAAGRSYREPPKAY